MPIPEVVLEAQKAATVDRVYGAPIERNGITFIPAAAVRAGGGGGGGTGSDTEGGAQGEGEGGGYGLIARPIGAFVITDGDVTWRPAVDVTRVAVIANLMTAFVAFVLWRLLRHR